jgi:hypothetical protein
MMALIASITIDAGLKRVHPPLPVVACRDYAWL